MNRVIVHLDADAFFASVEQAADPRLRGKPVAVGGEKRGIIASASYEARRMGIYTPMPISLARKICPKLIILPCDFEKYERFSRWMFSYAQDFTPDVEIDSIDEGYLDLTRVKKPAIDVAETIRNAIRQSLKISVSEGIGVNKLVSQVASKLKKPGAFVYVPPGEERRFLHPLPSGWLPGVGPKTEQQLKSAGLSVIGQIASAPVEMLQLLLGEQARILKEFASGIDERPVVPVCAPAKSYSKQETFPEDISDEEYIDAVIRRMADELMEKIRAEGKSIRTVTLRLRYNDMEEEQSSESLLEPTNLETDVYDLLSRMLRRVWRRRVSVRMVSVKFSNVYDGIYSIRLPLEGELARVESCRRLAAAVDKLRSVYGHNVIMLGHDIRLLNPPLQITYRNPSAGNQYPCPPSKVIPRISVYSRKKTLRWFPLNVRSHYSFLNSTLCIDAIVKLAVDRGISAIALTDTGNLHGAVEFVKRAREYGIKPIIGAEVYVNNLPLWLYVENERGYVNLCKLISEPLQSSAATTARSKTSQLDFYPDDTRTDSDEKDAPASLYQKKNIKLSSLQEFSDGLIVVSPDSTLERYFPARFYRAIPPEEALNCSSLDFRNGVAVMPIYYAAPDDKWKFNVVQSIRTRTLLLQAHPEKVLSGDYYFPSQQEPAGWFHLNPMPLERTAEIVECCNFELKIGNLYLPMYKPQDGSTPTQFLRRLVIEGLQRRYGARAQSLRAQIEEELSIISEVGYEEYFLVVWDLLQECKKRGIGWLTRGSAADSLVCYCLGISGICPIRFNLYFRRFLNKERMAFNKLPDIDIDFPHDRRDDVIRILFEKYGAEYTAVVGGFSTFQARSAVGDVAKVLGISERQIRKLTTLFPYSGADSLEENISNIKECEGLPIHEEPYKSAIQMAKFLDGFPRYPKMHPCGVVLSRVPIRNLTPTFISAKGYPTTHFDMDSLEAIGLVKMDILGQGGLSVIRDTERALKNSGIEIRSEVLEPWDDPAVWDMIASGDTRAVHHIESPAMVSLCKMTNVREIDGLVAIVSVIRPGAANEQKKMRFIRRYQGFETPTYPHPSLEQVLKETFGLIVYEEHILQICDVFAGLQAGKADTLRRALGKGKRDVVESIKQDFWESARARGRTDSEISTVWEMLCDFSGYAFCKAHSAAYAVEAYQSAWLKKYYPVHFMAAVLSNGKGFYSPLVYILECHRLGIKLLPPWINQPGPDFEVCPAPDTPRKYAIRIPALRAKGLTRATIEKIILERARGEFKSMGDFYHRVSPLPEEMELLIRVGAFDGFGYSRTTQFWEYRRLCAGVDSRDSYGQYWLFPPSGSDRLPHVQLDEPSERQKLQWEYDLLGFTASAHPLKLYDDILWESYCPVAELGKHAGDVVVCCGLVIEQRLHHQVTGEPMKFLTLADWTGIVESELFSSSYKLYGYTTVRYPVLEVTALVEPYENGRGCSLRILKLGEPRKR